MPHYKKKNDWACRDGKGTRLHPNDLVKVDFGHITPRDRKKYRYPFNHGDIMLYMGEIRRMSGHCIVANKQGQVFWGYHTENFVLLTKDEI